MEGKRQGEWIRGEYLVLKAFPFVVGTLYYTEKNEEDKTHTRFVHGLNIGEMKGRIRPEEVGERDESVFFAVREVFVEDETLYQVFDRLEGDLFALILQKTASFSAEDMVWMAGRIARNLLRLYEGDQFTIVHPQNMIITPDRSIRFLYGGRRGLLPKGAGPETDSEEARRLDNLYDSYTLGVLIYRMMTGKNPMAEGLKVSPMAAYWPACPAELDDLVARALSFDLNRRPRIEEFAEYLDWYAERVRKSL
jgi:hypothetical protein